LFLSLPHRTSPSTFEFSREWNNLSPRIYICEKRGNSAVWRWKGIFDATFCIQIIFWWQNPCDISNLEFGDVDVTRKLHGDSSTGRGLPIFGKSQENFIRKRCFHGQKAYFEPSKETIPTKNLNKIEHPWCTSSSTIHCDPFRQWCLRIFFAHIFVFLYIQWKMHT